MRSRPRIKPRGVISYFHLMSRTVNGEKWFSPAEKERLRKLIWRVSGFSGVRVITYAVMDNHFHLFVQVPSDREVSDEELVRRFALLYPEPTPWQPVSPDALARLLQEDGTEGKRLRRTLIRRMHDISWLMKTIKQRFATSFNARQKRFGPVWSERFKAVLVEGDSMALRTVAAYIDLNAVRSGSVKDPKDYRYCGYAEAVGGNLAAQAGIALLGGNLSGYRETLFGSGAAPRSGKASLDPGRAREVLEREEGTLPVHELLRLRLRFITEGFILGSPGYVERQSHPLAKGRIHAPRARRLAGTALQSLAVMNGTRRDPSGKRKAF